MIAKSSWLQCVIGGKERYKFSSNKGECVCERPDKTEIGLVTYYQYPCVISGLTPVKGCLYRSIRRRVVPNDDLEVVGILSCNAVEGLVYIRALVEADYNYRRCGDFLSPVVI